MGNDFIVMIHCLTYLAIHHENRYSSKDLAFNACSNPAIVRKLMSQAVKKGWVSTTAGKQGGYQWQGNPKEVRLGEIFLLVSEDERLEKAFKEAADPTCLVSTRMGSVMGKLQEEQIQQQINFYNKRTIQDMIDIWGKESKEDRKRRPNCGVFLCAHYNVYIIMIFLFLKHNNLKVFKNDNF